MVRATPRAVYSGLTPSEEEYIESIYRQEKLGKRVKVKELAKQLGVKDPSVVEMLKKLKEKGLVFYDHTGINLTKRGRKRGIKLVRRHELAERLLSDVFKHSLLGVHEHACDFEHIIDDDLTEKINLVLGKPTTCPHGEPIPNPSGKTIKLKCEPLSSLPEGKECVVLIIPEERNSVERLLSLNILPKARVKIVEKLPRGAIILQCGKTHVALSRDIASKILVKESPRHRHRHGRTF